VPVLREKFKNSKIIALHVDKNLPDTGIPAWKGGENIQEFLEREIPETDISKIRIIEWRPSLNFYGEACLTLLSQVVEYLKRAEAGRRTTSAFGKRWVRNFFRNLGNIHKTLLYRQTDIPVIVAGSGPSLETALPVIRQMKEDCFILAASSSLTALEHGGITPDMVIATDGGAWALRHIYPFFRNTERGLGFAVNLSAALPSQCASIPFLIMNDGSFWQSVILHELSLLSVIVTQKGTVTASAVELALLLTSGNIYLAGVDLSVRDIKTHARPYSFDSLFFESSDRFAPVYNRLFVRSGLIQNGGSLSIYAAWFKNRLASWPKRIFSLGDNHEVFEKCERTKEQGKSLNTNKSNFFNVVMVKDKQTNFAQKGKEALLKGLNDPRFAEALKAELTPLLFPGEKDVQDRELAEILKEEA
jgi:hypothetical protein